MNREELNELAQDVDEKLYIKVEKYLDNQMKETETEYYFGFYVSDKFGFGVDSIEIACKCVRKYCNKAEHRYEFSKSGVDNRNILKQTYCIIYKSKDACRRVFVKCLDKYNQKQASKGCFVSNTEYVECSGILDKEEEIKEFCELRGLSYENGMISWR